MRIEHVDLTNMFYPHDFVRDGSSSDMLYHSAMPECIELGISLGFAPMLANTYAPRYLSPEVREVYQPPPDGTEPPARSRSVPRYCSQ